MIPLGVAVRFVARFSMMLFVFGLSIAPLFASESLDGSADGMSASENETSPDDVRESRRLAADAKALIDQYTGDGAELSLADDKLRLALSLDDGNADAYVEMARLQMKLGGIDPSSLARAEELLRKGLAAEPEHGNSYVLLGYVFVHQQRLHLAESAFRDAHKFNATSPWLGMNEAELALIREDWNAAQKKYSKVGGSTQFPADVRAQAFEALARGYSKRGQAQKARDVYRQVMDLAPNNAWTMGNYSRLLRVSQLDVKESEVWGRKALDRMNYGWGRENLGSTLYLKWAEALVKEKDETKAQAIFAEAQQYLESPAEILHEIDEYPRPHPIIEALVRKGYSLDKYDGVTGSGTTPLTKAASRPNLPIVKSLLQAGANPNVQGFQGKSALMIAAHNGNLEMIEALLASGADPTLRDSDGIDAEAFAQKAHHDGVASLLKVKRSVWKAPPSTAHALKVGYVYRVKVASSLGGYNDEFKAQENLIYVGEIGLAARDGTPNKEIVGHQFQVPGKPHAKIWTAARIDGDEVWTSKFEEVGPAEGGNP